MLRLMRFGVYFETKMAIFINRNNDNLFALIMLGARGHMLQEKILKIWCSLVRFGVYFDQIVS